MKSFLILLMLFVPLTRGVASSPSEPFPVLLPVGQERRVEILGAQDIRVGLPQSLSKQLRVESMGAYLWLTAGEALEPHRVYLETDLGPVILSVRTDVQAPTTPLTVAAVRPTAPIPSSSSESVGYIALARYAIQSLYAPKDQVAPLSGVQRVPVDVAPVALFRCRAAAVSACGDAVESIPHAAWQFPPYYLMAVTVRNRLPVPLTLDPRDLRGPVLASAIVHSRLDKALSPRDTTTVVLISHFPPEHVW